jgi:hypothetical protein
MEQAFAAFVARMDRQLQNMRVVAREITCMLQRESHIFHRLTDLDHDIGQVDIKFIEAQLNLDD